MFQMMCNNRSQGEVNNNAMYTSPVMQYMQWEGRDNDICPTNFKL